MTWTSQPHLIEQWNDSRPYFFQGVDEIFKKSHRLLGPEDEEENGKDLT
jgi:hypothetical protein